MVMSSGKGRGQEPEFRAGKVLDGRRAGEGHNVGDPAMAVIQGLAVSIPLHF